MIIPIGTSVKLVTKLFIFRWDINCISELPEYMKPLFSALSNPFDELNNELAEEGRSYSVSFTKDMVLLFYVYFFIF